MKKYLSILLCVCAMMLLAGCAKEQNATYRFERDEEGLFTITDVQSLHAKGDSVYEIIETTTLDFSSVEDAALALMVEYYDKTVEEMKASAPQEVVITSSYADRIYELTMHLHLMDADLQTLVQGGYIMGIEQDTDLEKLKRISFEETCAGLEAAGYVLQENEVGACD